MARAKKVASKQIKADAIALVRQEKIRWETATAFVTDRVSFKMRNLIRIFRKNYYGVFDYPIDQTTGLEKVWYPLTEINVEAVVKNIDLDQKDINFRAKNPDGYGITDLTRNYVKDKLTAMDFGQQLDDFERSLAIDGTAVWKTYEEGGKIVNKRVDLLNIYIDPTSPSIHDSYRFTERSLMFPNEIEGMKGWMDTDDIVAVEGLPRTDPAFISNVSDATSNVKMTDVYEMWGKIPKYLITGSKENDDEEVDGHIVVSGLDAPGKERCHLIELNTKKDVDGNPLKPYEEAWYTRVPNRWYGRGIAEKLLMLQLYANIVLNVRINRSRVSQLGLFKIRKGSGITPQMLARLPSNGAIQLNSLDDLEQLVVQEVGATSYKDEDTINAISERLTNAFEVVTGESLPSSTPATNAVIQDRNAKSGFSLIKDGIGMFLTRWMDRHALPILAKEMNKQDLIRLAADDDKMHDIIDRIIAYQASEELDKLEKAGFVPTQQELQAAIQNAQEDLKRRGDLFIKDFKEIIANQIETTVYVTNEEMDVGVTVQNLLTMLQAAPQYADTFIREALDLLGLPQPKAQPAPQAPVPGQPRQTPPPSPLLQKSVQGANVPPLNPAPQ